METIEVRARQYDLSDATLVAGVLDAVRGHDSNKIESLRQPLESGAADLLAAAYWTLPGWYEKRCSPGSPTARGTARTRACGLPSRKLLAIPDTAPGINARDDTPPEVRTLALTWLDGDNDPDRFVRLYEDEEAQAAGIERYRGSEG